jgi:hypothetical protein
LTSLESLTLPKKTTSITAAGLAHLAGLTILRQFQGMPGDISSRGLTYLMNMKLESIDLRGAGIPVTDDTMVLISRLRYLQELDLDRCSVTDAGLAELLTLKSLRSLSLDDNQEITGAALGYIGKMSMLQYLRLTEAHQIGDNDLGHLSGLEHLKGLWIDSDQITDAGMVHLSKLVSLESLTFEHTTFTNHALSLLADLKNLEYLHLSGRFTDQGLVYLEGLTRLNHLTLSGEGLSLEALAELREEMPNLMLVKAEGAAPRQPSLTGRQLTEFDSINIDFTLEQAENEMVLFCFCDIDQRLSRRWLMQLSKRMDELKEKGVVIAAVQVSKLDKDKLVQWGKEQHIRFPMGMIIGDEQETRSNWGVKSLPWLVFTDNDLKIAAHGFPVEEIDKRIDAIRSSVLDR